jgi:hypothetical protein
MPPAFPPGQPGYPSGYPQQPGYPPMGGPQAVPSRTTTVVITALFGLFGMIPAYTHGKRAEAVGVPAGRYWKAFGITLGIVAAVYVAFFVVLFTFVLSVGTTLAAAVPESGAPADGAPADGAPETDAPEVGGAPPADVIWTAATITPLLAAYADEETEEWAAFSGDAVVTIPCGGEGAHGVSPLMVEGTAGGSLYGATAAILPDAGSATEEVSRLISLVADCGPHDYVSESSGEVLTRCDAPVVAALAPVIRYEQVCDLDPGVPYAFAIFQAGNAVVGLSAPTAGELDALLPVMLAELQAR